MGLYAFLARARPAASAGARAEALFVYAGSRPRKDYAARLWREGAARTLVLSVGRFEWRRYAELGLPGEAALRAAVNLVAPPERHFLVLLEASDAEVVPILRRLFGTRNEARALASLARARGWRSILVVSSGFHLRRAALATTRAFRGSGVALSFAAVPDALDPRGPSSWWRTPRGVRLIAAELFKLAVYSLLLRP